MGFALVCFWTFLFASAQSRPLETVSHRAFPVVDPDPGHTKLTIAKEGLDLIARIENPIAVVAVIGPYRSGKSFLLNQLLSLSCNEGFGVGHMRDTKTRGIWIWGEPMEMKVGNSVISVLFMDTEGFESIEKSNVYDDRIFALAALLSSVLIHNLPETVREADISKLSFAVELGEEFYGRLKGDEAAFEPAKLLWLIQRDFLEGKTVQEMVRDALEPVVNPTADRDVDQVNRIRESLSLMAENSTAFGLPQVFTDSLIFIVPNSVTWAIRSLILSTFRRGFVSSEGGRRGVEPRRLLGNFQLVQEQKTRFSKLEVEAPVFSPCLTYKLQPKEDLSYCLTALDDGTIEMNKCYIFDEPHQLWILDSQLAVEYGATGNGNGYVIVNVATTQALHHDSHANQITSMIPKNSHEFIWSLSGDFENHFKTIRRYENSKLNMDVDHGDKKHGGIKDKNQLILFPWHESDNQLWKLDPISTIECINS